MLWLVAVAALAAPSAASAGAGAGGLAWKPCFEEDGTFQCALMRVPLDYDKPGGATIRIAVIRQPATGPGKRIGSLVINPGGPGGPGVQFVREAGGFLFTPEVRARFDIVSFDPRGIVRSDQLRCFRSEEQWEPYFTDFAFPMSDAEADEWIAADTYLVRNCDKRAGAIIDHMATANVARDMDQLRKAVGDRKSAGQVSPTGHATCRIWKHAWTTFAP